MILVVDDMRGNRDVLRRLLEREGYEVRTSHAGADAIRLVDDLAPDLVLTDVRMPGMDGLELCRRLKSSDDTRLIPVVLLTARAEAEDRLAGIEAGADDFLSKPFNHEELRARVRSLLRLKQFTDELDSAEAVILSLAMTVEARDPNTGGHCERMARWTAAFGQYLDLPGEEVSALRRGGYLHDVGKIGLPDAVLLKPSTLTPDEFAVMKQHTVIGDGLCGRLRLLRPVRPIVRHHHERLDGSGYPDGLSGADVPLLAQVLGVVDVFDALTSPRPYREALPATGAYRHLADEAARGWRDPQLVEAFIRMHQRTHV